MGINNVVRQLEAEQQGGFTRGGGPREEQQVQMRGRNARGALPTRQRTILSTDEKLMLLGTITAGLLAVNTVLLATILMRL